MWTAERRRNLEEEEVERRRYAFLEQVYLITGADCDRRIDLSELETELGLSVQANETIVADLTRLGYLDRIPEGEFCLTPKAVAFLQREAWRRRSIRD
jgi:DNA-binding IclR family transcriptional regulator